ncbi:MAG: putative porin [Cytophagaceae bacterium]
MNSSRPDLKYKHDKFPQTFYLFYIILGVARRKILFAAFLFLWSVSVHAQIVDDTTQLIYGPHSTFYLTEDAVLNNKIQLHNIDSTLNGLHNFRHLYQTDEVVYQDLGQFGTALQNVYYRKPRSLGRQMGFDAFLPYGVDPERILYYDTRSPYTDIDYVQGGLGQQRIKVLHTRNISPRWNTGFSLHRMTSVKHLGLLTQRDPLASNWVFSVHNRYFSADAKYQILANFSLMDHSAVETGGILPMPGQSLDELFDFQLERTYLHNPISVHRQTALRIYQEYAIDSTHFQLFHIVDGRSRLNRFKHNYTNLGGRDTVFYTRPPFTQAGGGFPDPYLRPFPLGTYDQTVFRVLENKAGVKGSIGDLYFQAYFRRRDMTYQQLDVPDTYFAPLPERVPDLGPGNLRERAVFAENFIGGNVRYDLGENSSVAGNVEYSPGRDYRVEGLLDTKYFVAGASHVRYSPTLLQQRYIGNHLAWLNDFALTTVSDAYVGARHKGGFYDVSLTGNVSNVQRFIYFNQWARPEQTFDPVNIISADFNVNLWWKLFHFQSFTRYAETDRSDVMRIPTLFNHSRMYLEGKLFKRALFLQIGADIFWRDAYRGDNYMPLTQQFYLNEVLTPGGEPFLTGGYPLVNFFLNARIKTVRVFLQVNHANQYLAGDGYFVTPYYTDLPRNFIFGINWRFYD